MRIIPSALLTYRLGHKEVDSRGVAMQSALRHHDSRHRSTVSFVVIGLGHTVYRIQPPCQFEFLQIWVSHVDARVDYAQDDSGAVSLYGIESCEIPVLILPSEQCRRRASDIDILYFGPDPEHHNGHAKQHDDCSRDANDDAQSVIGAAFLLVVVILDRHSVSMLRFKRVCDVGDIIILPPTMFDHQSRPYSDACRP